MLKLLRLVTTKWGLVLTLLVLGFWQVYDTFIIPKENAIQLLRHTVVQTTIQKALRQMPPETLVRRIAIADLVGDRTGYVKHILTEELRKSDKFIIVDDTYVQRIIKEVLTLAQESNVLSPRLVENLEGGGVNSLEAAIELANRMGVEGVLFGEVRKFSVDEDQAQLEMHLRLADAQTQKALFGGAFSEEIGRYGYPYLGKQIKITPPGMRLFTWIAFTALFPLLSSHTLISYLRQESNWINLMTLVGLTVLDTLLAFVLLGFSVVSLSEQLLLMLAFISSLSYNYIACSHLEQMSH